MEDPLARKRSLEHYCMTYRRPTAGIRSTGDVAHGLLCHFYTQVQVNISGYSETKLDQVQNSSKQSHGSVD